MFFSCLFFGVFALFGFVCGPCLFFVCFLFSGDRIALGLLGLRTGSCSLLIPQRGNDARLCTIRSTGTTLLRPGESREGDGRKKRCIQPEVHLVIAKIAELCI